MPGVIPFYYDPTFLILIPAFLFALWAQFKTQSTFRKYSGLETSRGVRAEQAAAAILKNSGVNNVKIETVPGVLTDHYDPRTRVLRLSEAVYGHTSIAALGVAAHEAGHAIQHARGFAPIAIRNAVVPVANVASYLAIPLFFLGILFSIPVLMKIGIFVFTGVVAFHLVTIPVELDASRRAVRVLQTGSYLTPGELQGAKSVLNAAAMTYLAAALMARGRD